MRIVLVLLLNLGMLTMYSCPNPPDPPANHPLIVSQERIPWASIADSPWPILHHDPQFTGRSDYTGAENGIVERRVEIGTSFGSPVIGYDSTIYIGSYWSFYCMNSNGDVYWQIDGPATDSTPIVASDSTIYIPLGYSFTRISPNGDFIWDIEVDRVYSLGFNIDMDGNLYYVDRTSTLNVLNSAGEELWTLSDLRLSPGADSAPVFSPDGEMIFLQGDSVSIMAIDINTRTIIWTFGIKGLFSSPVIDNAGNLYFTPGSHRIDDSSRTFYSLSADGEINWSYNFWSYVVWDNTEPTIDHDGNIYFASDTLYAFQNNGELIWKYGFEDNVHCNSSLVCDANNVVYVGAHSSETGENQIMAVSQAGELLWMIRDSEERRLGPSPAISADGKLIYPTWDNHPGKLLIIH